MHNYSLIMETSKNKKKYQMKPKIKTSSMIVSTLRAYKNKRKKNRGN